MFKSISAKVDFVKLEKKLLSWWYKAGIVRKYLHKNDQFPKKFSFLDGPITANNPMGVHHAWGRTYKDLWQRFFNMRGFKQRFQNGFDNQGLWVEVEVEKELGFKNKKDIEKFGIEKFVNKCKERTLKFAQVQTEQSKRLGYFMDWDHSYYTMSDENNYMIWKFLKKCWQTKQKRGRALYKGRDSVPWCPRCGTAISQHEILTEEYKEITHDSVYLRFPLKGVSNEYLLVWTTTPWTILANSLVAVNPEIKYAKVLYEGKKYWVAASLVSSIFRKDFKVEEEVLGSQLRGTYYLGPFDDLPIVKTTAKKDSENFHRVVMSKELVSEVEGTGLVHIAPGCGAEDFHLAIKEYLYPELVILAIDEEANYLEGFGEFSGKNAKENPELMLNYLKKKENGKFLFKIIPYTHRYPVCWRCKTELVWRVVNEWYIAMDPFREKIKEVAKKIHWIPSWGLEMELDWLSNMSDWLISKKRYWGLALPIWECQKCGNFEVIGSKEELKKRAVEGWDEFEGQTPHRPWIDKVKIKCSKCGQIISRIPDVGNPWLDAGIVSFSTLKYQTDKKHWRDWFPADFITECFPGQFKTWFYSLLAMSTILENTNPFKTLLGHALVRDEKGEEMHKSKGNAIDFDEAAERIGVDVMRWMYCSQNPQINLNFGYHVADEVRRRFHLVLWNVYNFFVTYADVDKIKNDKEKSKNVLDRWIISRLNQLIQIVTKSLDDYDAFTASHDIEDFVNDLSTWYVRRSRDRVGPTADDGEDKNACYTTLYEVLVTLTKLLAPFTPFLAEEIYKNLTKEESVHLTDWPEPNISYINISYNRQMELVRKICELGHAARKEVGIRVRQPLKKLKIKNEKVKMTIKNSKWANELVQLIKDELNVKEVEFLGGKGELAVELETALSPKLKAEGEARELVRQIQELRKKANCRLDQKIKVYGPKWPEEKKLREYIKKETLARGLLVDKELKINALNN